MSQQTPITPAHFFWNAAAQEAGLYGDFWLDAYNRYLEAVQQDPSPSSGKWDIERTVRVPSRQGPVDVLVREQMEGREFSVLRFTVFPASDSPEPPQLERWYFHADDENKTPVLAEGALLDYINHW